MCCYSYSDSSIFRSGRDSTSKQKKRTITVSLADQKTYVYENNKLLRAASCFTGLQNGDGNPTVGSNLFHAVPVLRNNAIFSEEKTTLGSPTSLGCIRLSLRNTYWFYRTVPAGTVIHIQKKPFRCNGQNLGTPLLSQKQVTGWLVHHEHEYYQKHLLSCEAALTRLMLALTGIRDLDEDTILYSFPWGNDPETSFVCDNVDAGRRNRNGSIRWTNYGTNPPVVVAAISSYLSMYGRSSLYEVKEMKLSDNDLKTLAKNNDHFLGAIVWLIGHPDRWGSRPMIKKGLRLGEHVRFVDPELDKDGKFLIWDPENHPNQPYHSDTIPTRDMFDYRTVVLFRK